MKTKKRKSDAGKSSYQPSAQTAIRKFLDRKATETAPRMKVRNDCQFLSAAGGVLQLSEDGKTVELTCTASNGSGVAHCCDGICAQPYVCLSFCSSLILRKGRRKRRPFYLYAHSRLSGLLNRGRVQAARGLRRRHQASTPPSANTNPGSPAPAMGPGTPTTPPQPGPEQVPIRRQLNDSLAPL